jgi:hypothetical protein
LRWCCEFTPRLHNRELARRTDTQWPDRLSNSDARRYVVLRTKEWLKLAGIAFNERLVEELTAPAGLEQKASCEAARTKRVRIMKPARARA